MPRNDGMQPTGNRPVRLLGGVWFLAGWFPAATAKRWVARDKNGYKEDVTRPFIRIVALLVFSAIFPHLAVADWQYTRWGMTADQIVTASNGAARKLAGTEQEVQSGATFTALAVATFKTGPFDFAVSFRADKGGNTLKTVRLTLGNRYQYQDLSNAFSAKYGRGEVLPKEANGAIERVRWQTKTETIVLQRVTYPMDLGTNVSVDYEKPLANLDL
jgi:hypothetical protein